MDTKTRIFELLKARKISQKALAEELGLKNVTVTDWKRGKSNSYNDCLVQIAQILGTTVEYLLTGKESSPPSEKSELHRRIDLLTPENAQRLLGYLDSLEAQQEKP